MADHAQCPSCKRELVCPDCSKDVECPVCLQTVRLDDFGALPDHNQGNRPCVASKYTTGEAQNMLRLMGRR
jgi:hypothetical protein